MDREQIGKYRILGELGRGTMGEVYRALDPVLNRTIALKTLSARLDPDDEALQRFHREAQAAALLNHPNIVTVHDFGEEQGVLYMAMELLKGTDLRDAIDNDLLGGLDKGLDVVDGVLKALEYAHARGVIHRDVKPANIFLADDGLVKITDFGLAKLNTTEMTQEGIVLGTPNYMSPEQAMGDRVDGRTDLFSTGAVLYELLTGHKPFEADSTPSVLFQVVHRQPPPVRRWAPHVPAPLVEVVNRSLAKSRDERYGSAAEMREALAAARETSRAARRPAPPPLPPSQSQPTLPAPRPPAPSASQSAARRRRSAPGSSARRRAASPGRRSSLPWVAIGAALALAVLLVAAPWVRERVPLSRPAADAQVGELTKALVATQVQLAQRELDDKNWEAARAQAESALSLAPDHPEAARVLESARARLAELDAAVAAAQRALGAGQTGAASAQLSRLLELDPRHPAASELSARLNAVFRTQSDEAAAAARGARAQAVAAGASGLPEFTSADAAEKDAETKLAAREFADATRSFLAARDGFDRARRAAPARAAERSAPAAATPTPAPRTPPTPARAEAPAPALSAPPREPAVKSTPTPPPPRFVTGRTTVTTPAAGELAGFETDDVSTRQQPRFVGRMEFEVLPAEVRPGDPFVVRIQLVNEGGRGVRLEGIELTTIQDGQRATSPARLLQRQVPARGRALVAEYSSTWSSPGSWSLQAVAAVEGDETVRSRLESK